MEILPVGQSTYKSGANAQIAFQISSNSDILCGRESYFRFEFKNTCSNTTVVPTTEFTAASCAFDVGGINALFQSIEIRQLGSGITLQRYDEYNRWNALASLLYDSEQDVEQMACSGDDLIPGGEVTDGARLLTSTTATATAGVTWTASSNTLVLSGAAFRSEQNFGPDSIVTVNLAAGGWTARVVSVTNDTTVVLSNGPGANIACTSGAAGEYGTVSLLSPYYEPFRSNWRRHFHVYPGAGEVGHVVIFKPRLSLLQHNLPLFLMKGGIEIIFTLADGGRGIQLVEPVATADLSATLQYEIYRPRYFAQMITPHPDIVDEYIRQWKSPTGLIYSIPSVKSRRVNGPVADASGTSLNFTVGVRSARRAYLVVQPDSLAQAAPADIYGNLAPSVSCHPRTNIRYYQAKIGSHEYPNRPVQTLSGNSTQAAEFTEAWQQLMMVAGPMVSERRLKFHHHHSKNYEYYASANNKVTDSRHFIMAFDFSRDKGLNGDLTGADLSIVPLMVDLTRSAASSFTGTYIYQLFVEHDSFLKISSEQTSVMN